MQQHTAHEMEKISKQSYQPQVRQPGSIPFLWEEKPGTPKKEWNNDILPVTSVPSPSAKLVISVPFNWEEEPGKPIISPSYPILDSPFPPLPTSQLVQFTSSTNSTRSSSSTTVRGKLRAVFQRTNPFLSSSEDDDDDSSDDDDMLELDFRAFGSSLVENHTIEMSSDIPVQSNDSLNLQKSHQSQHGNWAISVSKSRGGSTKDTNIGTSVLEFQFTSSTNSTRSSSSTTVHGKLHAVFQRANPFLSSSEDDDDDSSDDDDMLELDFRAFGSSLVENHTIEMSSDIPVQSNDSLNLQKSHQSQHGNWAISVSKSRGGSTKDTNIGTSVLEFLFPLFPPDSGFLNNVKYQKNCVAALPAPPMKENTYKSNCTLLAKRSPTLLELIQMSRRISCRRKAVQVKKQSFPMEFMRVFDCCFFGAKAQQRKPKYRSVSF